MLTLRTPYLDNDFVRTNYRAPQSALMSKRSALRLDRWRQPPLRQIPTDRASSSSVPMIAGLVRRYHDSDLQAEYATTTACRNLPQASTTCSWLHLERLFLGRHKYLPFRVLVSDALSKYLCAMLLDERTLSRPCWDRRGSRKSFAATFTRAENLHF